MNPDDLILISVDDHIAEPADMFERHVPARYREHAPRVVDLPDGSQQWYYGDIPGRNLGLNAVAGKPRCQSLVLQRAVAVVDAIDAEDVQRLPDILRRTFLAGMGDEAEPLVPGAAKHLFEFAWWVPDLRRIEADADEPVLVGERLVQSPLGIGGIEMAQEAHDEMRAQAELRHPVFDRLRQSVDDGGEGDAARGVALRIEEHLDIAHILRPRPGQVRPGEIVEILLGPQHRHALIVEVEEILQVGEAVGLAQRFDRVVGQRDAVAQRQREHQFGLEAALDVDMQLRLRQLVGEGRDIGHASSCVPKRHRGDRPVAPAAAMPCVA